MSLSIFLFCSFKFLEMRSLAISQEHELLQKLESAGLNSDMAQKIITSKGNNLAKKVVEFLKNELKIVEKVLQFLSFVCVLKIQLIKKFRVGDFFKHRQGPIQMYLGDNFKNWILEKSKDLELSLEEETELSKFKLIKNAWDSEIHSDFEKKPIIPVKIFLPLLKALIEAQPKGEAKEDGLDNSGYSNIFNVDLTEINPSLGVVAVDVYWLDDAWNLCASSLAYGNCWVADGHFFSLVTS